MAQDPPPKQTLMVGFGPDKNALAKLRNVVRAFEILNDAISEAYLLPPGGSVNPPRKVKGNVIVVKFVAGELEIPEEPGEQPPRLTV